MSRMLGLFAVTWFSAFTVAIYATGSQGKLCPWWGLAIFAVPVIAPLLIIVVADCISPTVIGPIEWKIRRFFRRGSYEQQ
jgi:hypothetical protein